jgi:hypothetical protein
VREYDRLFNTQIPYTSRVGELDRLFNTWTPVERENTWTLQYTGHQLGERMRLTIQHTDTDTHRGRLQDRPVGTWNTDTSK